MNNHVLIPIKLTIKCIIELLKKYRNQINNSQQKLTSYESIRNKDVQERECFAFLSLIEKKIQKTGADIKKFKVSADGNKVQNQNLKGTKIVSNNSDNNSTNTNSVVSENLMITKKQLQENRLKQLKKNSELFTVKDFINKIKK